MRESEVKEVELAVTFDAEPRRAATVASASTIALANSVGFLAATKLPRPLTEACHRSSMRSASSASVGSPQRLEPLAMETRSVDGLRLPCRPIDTPMVTMCCQNAGSLLETGTLLVS